MAHGKRRSLLVFSRVVYFFFNQNIEPITSRTMYCSETVVRKDMHSPDLSCLMIMKEYMKAIKQNSFPGRLILAADQHVLFTPILFSRITPENWLGKVNLLQA